ncbi:MAG: ABC transporter permease subunit [bacterium]
MWVFILRALKDRKRGIIIYSISAALLMWMMVAIFPSIEENAANFDKLLESYPEALMKAFNIETLDLSKLEGYVAVENYSFMWPIIMLFFIISLAGTALAAEVERGTADILLSRKLSRAKIFWGRYTSGLIAFLVFNTISHYSVIIFAEMHNVDYDLSKWWSIWLLSFLFGIAVYGLAMMFSAWFSERGKVYMLSGGVLVAMYALNIIAGIKDNLADLKYLSFFYYYNADVALRKGEILNEAFIVFLVVAILSAVIGMYVYNKRDIQSA